MLKINILEVNMLSEKVIIVAIVCITIAALYSIKKITEKTKWK